MKAAILYWSKSGNTEKVALAIKEGLEAAGAQVDCLKTGEAAGIDYFAYDLICVGFPSYHWHVPEPVDAFLKKKHAGYRDQDACTLSLWGQAIVIKYFFFPLFLK
ncbi:MAG: flavodoxin domain-containing protein, partial [Thermodesulfobacteriota bacterium]|nr:flavodoxin domain-containing protein [Thermodesulfobacteriota bacterium]